MSFPSSPAKAGDPVSRSVSDDPEAAAYWISAFAGTTAVRGRPLVNVSPAEPFRLARQFDGFDSFKLDAAFLDQIVQITVGRARDFRTVKINLERAAVILAGPGRGIADALHSGRYPVGFLIEALGDVLAGRSAILAGPVDGFLHVQRAADRRDVMHRTIDVAGGIGHL